MARVTAPSSPATPASTACSSLASGPRASIAGLGMIVERVSGKSYEEFVTERIFRRAGMSDTRFKHPEDVVRNRAGGYVDHGGVFQNGERLRPSVIAANGGILSSAEDMAKWDIALGKGDLVTLATLGEMLAPIRTNDGTPFNAGMAWFLDTFRGHRLILHNGSTVAGYSSVVYRCPDDRLGVIVLMNVDRWNAVNVLATRIASFYVPGLSLGALPESTDPDPEMSRKLVALLADVAENRDSDLLAPNLRNRSGLPRTTPPLASTGATSASPFWSVSFSRYVSAHVIDGRGMFMNDAVSVAFSFPNFTDPCIDRHLAAVCKCVLQVKWIAGDHDMSASHLSRHDVARPFYRNLLKPRIDLTSKLREA